MRSSLNPRHSVKGTPASIKSMEDEHRTAMTKSAPQRVLVVEDESITALDIKSVLIRHGYAVPAVAKSGKDAIEKAAEFDPNLVLMDISLHGEMDGVEAAETIRRRFDRPVIYLTAYADRETTQRARLTEPHGYLLKPFDERELLIAVEMALYRHQMEARLKDSERWLAATLRDIGDAVIATDSEWRIRFMNPRAESLTGWDVNEAIGRELAEILRVSITAGPRPISATPAAAGGGTAQGVLTSRSGREIAIEENSTTIRNDRGSVIGAVIAIRERNDSAHPEVAPEERPGQGRERIGSGPAVLAGLSREIRATLAAVIGNTDLIAGHLRLLEGHGDNDQDELLRALKLSCQRLAAAVDTALSKIEPQS